jgi:hypothetical protein
VWSWVALQKQQRRKLEPFEVPKSGHFFLHDDRTAGGGDNEKQEEDEKNKRPQQKKKLWADEGGKWKHDKFEQLEQVRLLFPFLW